MVSIRPGHMAHLPLTLPTANIPQRRERLDCIGSVRGGNSFVWRRRWRSAGAEGTATEPLPVVRVQPPGQVRTWSRASLLALVFSGGCGAGGAASALLALMDRRWPLEL
jgi:hypothetical protein